MVKLDMMMLPVTSRDAFSENVMPLMVLTVPIVNAALFLSVSDPIPLVAMVLKVLPLFDNV